MRLSGKVCIVTGAGSGIGQASALLFAEEGATVVSAELTSSTPRQRGRVCEQSLRAAAG